MKCFLAALALCLWLTPAFAGSIAVTPGAGTTIGAGSDGTSQIPATILCGATASATLYATCVNQAIVNASGQLLTLNTQGTSPWIIAGGGTAGSSGTAVLTIQGIASGTAVPISGALTANQSVNVAQVNGVTTLTGTGAVGTGAQRVAIGTDTATIAGSAPGTAGSASTAVVTVQGIAGGTNLPVSLAANQSVNLAQVGGTSTSSSPLMVAASTAPVTATNSALTVDLRPDSPGIITLGQTTKSASVPVTIASDQTSMPALPTGATTVALSRPTVLSSQYPVNNNTTTPTPETISATGTTTAFTATLAVGTASQTVYMCGFSVDATATAGTTVAMTVTGTVTGTMNFIETVATLAGVGFPHNFYAFNPCIPASAANTAIVLHAGAAGSGGVVSASMWGYLL